MDAVRQPVTEAEIKQRIMAVTRPFNELSKKLGMIESMCLSQPSPVLCTLNHSFLLLFVKVVWLISGPMTLEGQLE